MANAKVVNSFDFSKYNEVMKNANSGLKLFLAGQLMNDVEQVMRRFDSPYKDQAIDIVDKLTRLRAQNKAYLASRDKAIEDKAREIEEAKKDNTTDGKLDSMEHLQVVSNSADAGKVTA